MIYYCLVFADEVILLYAIAFIGLVGITGLVVAINIYK